MNPSNNADESTRDFSFVLPLLRLGIKLVDICDKEKRYTEKETEIKTTRKKKTKCNTANDVKHYTKSDF